MVSKEAGGIEVRQRIKPPDWDINILRLEIESLKQQVKKNRHFVDQLIDLLGSLHSTLLQLQERVASGDPQ